ncbi:MAG: NAD(P)-dependent oxidoreductase [Polyangiaceae bacterium]|nr:NAD(P)-dependent oxidoreductase [Polyangiaceae bacterium]
MPAVRTCSKTGRRCASGASAETTYRDMNANTEKRRAPVTVLGLGAMGQALARAFLNAGHPTTVWNRSPDKGADLVEKGAVRAATVKEAVQASGLVVVCVVDAAASQAILESAASAMKGRVVVDVTSDTPEKARAAAAWATRNGIEYIDGAVMVPTVSVGTPEALFLYSGNRGVFDAHLPTLRVLGGNARYVGPEAGMAALFDLALLDVFYSSSASIVHAFSLVGANGVMAKALLPYVVEFFAIMPGIADMLATNIDNGKHPGALDNLTMEATGVDHIIEASHDRGVDASVLEAVRSLFRRAIDAGHGADSLSSLAEVIRKRAAR